MAILPTRPVITNQNIVWDVNTLSWVKMTQPGGSVGAITLPDEGQQTMANSISVAIASDQSAVPVSGTVTVQDGGNVITVDSTNLDIRDLTFAADKVDASGTTLGANSGVDIGDVTINNASGGSAVNIQDGGNTITVDGTVTANAGTNLNTSLLALESGGNLAQIDATLDRWERFASLPFFFTSVSLGPSVATHATSADPSWSDQDAAPLSVTLAGRLRVDGSGVTQPISGTVTANAGTNLNTSLLALESGGNLASINTQLAEFDHAGFLPYFSVSTSMVGVSALATDLEQIWIDGDAAPLNITATGGRLRVETVGKKTSDADVPGATNIGTLPAIATEAAPANTEGNQVGLSSDLEGNLRTRTSGLVSDAPASYLDGDIKPLSLTSDGRLRVVTVNESYNHTAWGSPYSWESSNSHVSGQHPLTAW